MTNYLIRWHDIRKADYVGIFVTDNRGALVVSSIPQVEYYYGKTSWWQAVMKAEQGKVFVSDIFFDPSFGTHVVNVSAPILDDEQHVAIGAVTVLLRRDTLFHSVSEVTVGQTGHAMLFNSDGVPLICPVLSPEEHAVTPELVERHQCEPCRLEYRGERFAWRTELDRRICAGSFRRSSDIGQFGR